MKIAIAGASGLVGRAASERLKSRGHEVVVLQRHKNAAKKGDIVWDPRTGEIDREALEGVDGVINLMGENIAAKRWSASVKKGLWDSRVLATQNLVSALSTLNSPPKVLINASAIGFYGETGSRAVDENAPAGKGFLPPLCKAWEEAADAVIESGIRLVKLRIGVVLSTKGGALAKMLLPFKLGLGGRIGSGEQYMSWITLNDLVSVIEWCLQNEEVHGTVNAVSPEAVTNSQFTKSLGRALRRPTIFPLPAFLARTIMGEMAEELLLASSRITPKVLTEANFNYSTPTLDGALKELLNDTH